MKFKQFIFIIKKDIVKIRNVSQESTCFQIGLLPRNSKFTVIWRNKANRQRKIAPGMHYLLEILFKTKDHSDSEEYLTLKVENGKPCVIKLKSYRDCPILRGFYLQTKMKLKSYFTKMFLL